MEADFSGWATKAGLKCSDGRTIMPDAFKHQDKVKVPLVWQHGHNDPENVLGHAILEHRPGEGIWCEGFFNGSPKAQHMKEAVEHEDVNSLSIWANKLVERASMVYHGMIREVSLVLSGANPGALIQNITISHGEGYEDTIVEDEAIIYSGVELSHADDDDDDEDDDEETIQDVYDSMSDKQKQVLHYMVGEALQSEGGEAAQSALEHAELGDDATVQEVYDSMTDAQKEVLHYMVGEAMESAGSAEHSDTNTDPKGNDQMGKHNVFEQNKDGVTTTAVLSHSDIEGIVADATKNGSLKEAVEAYAISHGIQDIEVLFPEARTINNTPELFSRRQEWVSALLGAVTKSPFSRVRTMSADITVQEARAKGYIKGNLKKEEFFRVRARITTPQTVYKKQKLDRDDILDITDFDVVAWLKGEMRLMLDEEIARAVLVGDGRAVESEDKINEDHVRPVANDHELYTTTITVELDGTNETFQEALDQLVLNRSSYRGSGLPTLFTTERYIARLLLLRDNDNRKIYKNLDEAKTDLRFKDIVAVEVLEEYPDILGVYFNPMDYTIGADKGGNVSMFEDFDIDYNQHKYLIETRISGALTKLKSAVVIRVTAVGDTLVAPAAPAFDGDAITITDQAGVIYRNAATDAVMNAAGSPYAVADGQTVVVNAEPDTGYYFQTSNDDSWSFLGEA